jgi:hypothetical protein
VAIYAEELMATTWKPHALAKPHPNQLELDRGDKVESTVELPGVPVGTQGVVMLANGFNWLRYRVRFDNDVELSDLDGRNIKPAGRTARKLARRDAKKK